MSGWGNLGAGPKPPQWVSKRRARASRARVSRAGAVGEGGVGGRDGQVGHAAEGVGEPGRLLAHLGALVPPPLVDRPQDLLEGGHAVAGLVRVVGAAVEGTAVGGEEDGHGPAAGAGHGLHRLHVDGVDVGLLLPVDLHADEQLVHEGGGGFVLERLVGHHVAPVAGGVADGEQDRLVLGAGPLEGLVAPRVPVDGVVLVLLEVGARLVGQPVHGPKSNSHLDPTNWPGANGARRPPGGGGGGDAVVGGGPDPAGSGRGAPVPLVRTDGHPGQPPLPALRRRTVLSGGRVG